jgi:hypothetical protein
VKKLKFGLCLVAVVFGCASEHSPVMKPGENCMACHDGNQAPAWTAAGTIFPDINAPTYRGLQGITIKVTDAEGRTVTMVSNAAGNFYTAEPLTPPLGATVESNGVVLTEQNPLSRGACNSCHTIPPLEETKGRLYWSPS